MLIQSTEEGGAKRQHGGTDRGGVGTDYRWGNPGHRAMVAASFGVGEPDARNDPLGQYRREAATQNDQVRIERRRDDRGNQVE